MGQLIESCYTREYESSPPVFDLGVYLPIQVTVHVQIALHYAEYVMLIQEQNICMNDLLTSKQMILGSFLCFSMPRFSRTTNFKTVFFAFFLFSILVADYHFSDFYQVIDLGGEGIKSSDYFGNGRVTEFKYGAKLGKVIRKWDGEKMAYLK